MKKNLLVLLTFCSLQVFSQSKDSTYLYKGFIDSKISIILYLHTSTNTCDGLNRYDAMYKYEKNSNWIQLDVTRNDSEKNFCLVEQNFTGVLLLSKSIKGFSGIWINAKADKQFKTELNLQKLSSKLSKELDLKYEKLNYENNDC